ncbi:hypothetical protein ABH11_01523 [Serratia marcescens]|uniref:hypothetical protein n=1 Tax=Serratia marcescens TaxID=615 RepID=UPI0006CB724C|nr:hypothetical protein [Serratia marcescens]ALE95867.1 hypothetical protein ABH11_01523 [Serratia marcescens]
MVQRYNPDYVMHAARFAPFAREAEHGEFVKFSDYEALVSELASSRQINAQTLQVKLTMAETIKELTERVNALAVENAALKKSEVPLGAIENGRAFADRLEAYPFECQGGSLSMCSDWQELRRCFDHLSEWAMHGQSETPATDAALAAIEARAKVEAIELLIGRKKRELADMHPDTHAFGMTSALIRNQIRCLESFATELREAK